MTPSIDVSIARYALPRLTPLPDPASPAPILTLAATVLLLFATAADARQTPVGPMPTVDRSVIEARTVPPWLYGSSSVQLEINVSGQVELAQIAIVSNEHGKRAALIGMLRSLDGALKGVVVTLSYLRAESGTVVKSISNAALVSEVPLGGFLPFRFPLPLRSDLPDEILSLRLSVTDGVPGSRHAIRGTMGPGYSFRRESARGVLVVGDIHVWPEESVQLPAESEKFITLVLLDREGTLLDVLAGSPMSRDKANVLRFEFESFLPIRRRVKSIQVYLEAQPTTR